MADMEVIQASLTDKVEPSRVLLVFNNDVSLEDIEALASNFPFTPSVDEEDDDDVTDITEILDTYLRTLYDLSSDADQILPVRFEDQDMVRAEGSWLQMKLVTDGNLLAVLKITNADLKAFMELDRQLNEIQIVQAMCDELRPQLEMRLFRKANNPADYIRNFAAIEEKYGNFQHDMIEDDVELDIDESRTRTYDGPCNELLAALVSSPKRELDEHMDKMRAFIESMRLVA